MRLEDLIGNPDLDREEVRQAELDDVRSGSGGPVERPGDVGAEMATAFGWDVEETPEEAEAHYQSWLASQRQA